MTFALIQHAVVRTQQRGVPHHLIDTLMSFTEFEAPVGGGCTILRMTRDRLDDLDLADRLNSGRVRPRWPSSVWSERTGENVTVLRLRRLPAGRRYRRGRQQVAILLALRCGVLTRGRLFSGYGAQLYRVAMIVIKDAATLSVVQTEGGPRPDIKRAA